MKRLINLTIEQAPHRLPCSMHARERGLDGVGGVFCCLALVRHRAELVGQVELLGVAAAAGDAVGVAGPGLAVVCLGPGWVRGGGGVGAGVGGVVGVVHSERLEWMFSGYWRGSV